MSSTAPPNPGREHSGEFVYDARALRCRICRASSSAVHRCRERMFGTGEVFSYSECSGCGSLQLLDIPLSLSDYYPSDYYSYAEAPDPDGRIERAVKAIRTLFVLNAPSPLLRALPSRLRPVWADWFRGSTRSLGPTIVDVGAGSGRLATYLFSSGFRNVAGYDPFLAIERLDGPVPLFRDLPPALRGHVRVAMLHHSLEHTLDPVAALWEAAALLEPQGTLVVRIPLADSFAWRHYCTDWIALDPPRHIFLLTESALDLIAAAAGLQVVSKWRDSAGYQFWASEQLRRGIVLEDDRSLWRNPTTRAHFSQSELQEFDKRASELNALGEGDAGCFILRRVAQA